jgi:hypothetical protein
MEANTMRWSRLTVFGASETSEPAFFVRVLLEKLVVGLGLAVLMHAAGQLPATPVKETRSKYELFVVMVLLFPLLETFVFQFGAISILRAAGVVERGQVILSALPFAMLHFSVSFAFGICAGVVGGTYLGFAYVRWARSSARRAFWLTSLLHAVSNLILVIPIFLLRP